MFCLTPLHRHFSTRYPVKVVRLAKIKKNGAIFSSKMKDFSTKKTIQHLPLGVCHTNTLDQ